MDNRTFETLRDIIYKESGIVLPPEKKALLTSRLQKRLRALNIEDEKEYLKIIELDTSGMELVYLINVISTNVTYFYRESQHFQTYRSILKEWQKQNKPNIKVWCAASSSGEEPYTLAIEASEVFDNPHSKIKILATDVSLDVLNKAVLGKYSGTTIDKIPSEIKNKYLLEVVESGQKELLIKPDTKKLVLFKKLNLVDFPYPVKGPIDIIFCRNVMIYFDTTTRTRIVAEFTKLLAKGGYLFLSHSENLLGVEHQLTKLNGSIYQKL